VSNFPDRVRDVGVIMDLAIHDIDVIRYITGSRIRSVYAQGGRMLNTRYEDQASILMEMDDKVTATIEVNWLTPMKVRQLSLTCSSGFAQVDYIDQSLKFSASRFSELNGTDMSSISMELDTHHLFVKKEEPLRLELETFVQAARTLAKPAVDGWDALENLMVCDGALTSMEEERKVDIPVSQEIERPILLVK
jgi:UDP-N-acetylglucosamine 3-dehydrogenase